MPIQASSGRTGVVVSAVVIAALAGCGGGGDYCGEVEGVVDDFAALQQVAVPGDRDTIENLASSYSEVAGTAPDDVQEQWENLASAMEVLAEANAEFANLDEEGYAHFETVPDDIDTIATFTLDECDIDLNS